MKDLAIDPRYAVTEDGQVFSKRAGRFLKPGRCSNGYLAVSLGRGARFLVHRLVAQAFLPNPEAKGDVNHLNGDRADNRAANLEWATRSENQQHAHRSLPRKAHAAMRAVKALAADGTALVFPSISAMARAFGVNDGSAASAEARGHRCKGYEVKHV